MVAEEFLVQLDKIKDSFEWKLAAGPFWPQDRRSRPRLRIVATSRRGLEGLKEFSFDLIGAVCFSQTGIAYNTDEWLESADQIGLSLMAAGDLIAAANDRTWMDSSGHRVHDLYIRKLRDQLFKTVGLDRQTLIVETPITRGSLVSRFGKPLFNFLTTDNLNFSAGDIPLSPPRSFRAHRP